MRVGPLLTWAVGIPVIVFGVETGVAHPVVLTVNNIVTNFHIVENFSDTKTDATSAD